MTTRLCKQEWLLQRNRSLTPRQLGLAYGLQCCLSFPVALAVALQGAWYVLIFSALEMALLACAFLYYLRHAGDHEHIALGENFLLIERVSGGRAEEIRLDPRCTRILPPRRGQRLIRLHADGIDVEVGRFVPEPRRRQVAIELRAKLVRDCVGGGDRAC